MAGTLELSERLCWMPAGWIFDNALEGMAKQLDGEMRDRFLGSLTDINGGYLDLQQASADELRSIRSALQTLIDKVLEAGPYGMHNAAFFDGYLQQLRELAELLESRLSER